MGYTTRPLRASYLHAITPKASAGSTTPKYSVMLLIPKSDKETIRELKEAIAAAHKADIDGKNLLKGVKTPKNPLHDGDGEKPNGGEYDESCKGHWVMNASSTRPIGLVGRDRQVLTDANEWYSGIYVRAAINFYAYNSNGNKGIACGLNHLQKWRDGEALGGGGGSPESAFKDDYEDEDDSVFG